MKKRWIGLMMIVVLPFVLIGCGNFNGSSSSSSKSSATSSFHGGLSSSSASSSSSTSASSNSSSVNSATQTSRQSSSNPNTANPTNTSASSESNNPTARMIIYNANLSIVVKDYNQFQKEIENDVQGYKGYILSMSQDNTQGNVVSNLTIRVPQPKFYTLLDDIKKNSEKVLHNQISGKDVTKQYVDLQSQLKAKQLVEQRLQSFMKKATNTTDLLKISDELDKVETDIDTIKGQMKYLENQSSLSTITLVVTENKVHIPKLQTKDLNTWQKAQKAFMSTIKGLATSISWLVVFLIGAAPVLIILLVAVIIYLIWRKKRHTKDKK